MSSEVDEALQVLRRALGHIDPRGHFVVDDLPALREAVDHLAAHASTVDHPADLFGPWADLPVGARNALRSVVARDVRESAALYPRGSIWTGAIRACRRADAYLTERRPGSRLRRLCVRGATRLHDGPFHGWRRGRAAYHRHRWARSMRPRVGDALAALGRDPRWLIGDFVRGVPLPPCGPGLWEDPARTIVHGLHLGLDLLPTPTGILCIEANLRTGIKLDRLEIGVWEAVFVEALALARSVGARRLVWVELQELPLIDQALEDLAERARAAGVALEVLEDPTMKPQGVRSSRARDVGVYRRLDGLAARTLVLSRRGRPWGVDFLITDKDAANRVMEAYLRRTGDPRFEVLPMTREPRLPVESDPGRPNLVYKYPDSGAGKGVFFMRARDEAHAVEMARRLDRDRREPPGLFQPFAQGRLVEGRHVFDVRTEILMTPGEARVVAAMRRVSGRSVPERVDYGVVEETAVFASNLMRGGRLQPVGDEASAIRDAALAVGEALRHGANETFVTRRPSAR